MKKIWVILDARANYDKDRAVVFETCETESEAMRNRTDYGDDCVVRCWEVGKVNKEMNNGR